MSQQEEIDRVEASIGEAVKGFWSRRLTRPDPLFYMEDLTDSVKRACTVAPDSPGRILRSLRQKGEVNYEIVSRSDSLYRALALP